jgi:hypothetical protein
MRKIDAGLDRVKLSSQHPQRGSRDDDPSASTTSMYSTKGSLILMRRSPQDLSRIFFPNYRPPTMKASKLWCGSARLSGVRLMT